MHPDGLKCLKVFEAKSGSVKLEKSTSLRDVRATLFSTVFLVCSTTAAVSMSKSKQSHLRWSSYSTSAQSLNHFYLWLHLEANGSGTWFVNPPWGPDCSSTRCRFHGMHFSFGSFQSINVWASQKYCNTLEECSRTKGWRLKSCTSTIHHLRI